MDSERVFPEWYRPTSLNYTGSGVLLFTLGMLGLFTYSYLKDIKEVKGRTKRRIFENDRNPTHKEYKQWNWG